MIRTFRVWRAKEESERGGNKCFPDSVSLRTNCSSKETPKPDSQTFNKLPWSKNTPLWINTSGIHITIMNNDIVIARVQISFMHSVEVS